MGISRLRIFVSSPSDVANERQIAFKAIENLNYDPVYRPFSVYETAAWENTPLTATATPQDTITRFLGRPAECDIFILILWSKLGTVAGLPGSTNQLGIELPLTGTLTEYLDALASNKKNGTPEILVYRRTEKVIFDSQSDLQEQMVQWNALQQFFSHHFENLDTSLRGYNNYEEINKFTLDLSRDLRAIIGDKIARNELSANESPEFIHPIQFWEGNPYPGLDAFDSDRWKLFFGREQEIDDICDFISNPTTKLVAIFGPSGVGKSSLARAGVGRRLAKLSIGECSISPVVFSPFDNSSNPTETLANHILSICKGYSCTPVKLAQELTDDAASILPIINSNLPKLTHMVIIIDQFEQILHQVEDEIRTSFCRTIWELTKVEHVSLALVVRSDYFDDFSKHVDYDNRSTEIYNVKHPDKFILKQMIEQPCLRAGKSFEPKLLEQMISETGEEAGALPLLAYAAQQLYIADSERDILTARTYEEIGKVDGAIATIAEDAFKKMQGIDNDEKEQVLSWLFSKLVTIDTEMRPMRRKASRSEIASIPNGPEVLQVLIDARIVNSGEIIDSAEDLNSPETARNSANWIIHDAVLTAWPACKDWIEKNGRHIITRRRVLEFYNDSLGRLDSKDKNSEEDQKYGAAAIVNQDADIDDEDNPIPAGLLRRAIELEASGLLNRNDSEDLALLDYIENARKADFRAAFKIRRKLTHSRIIRSVISIVVLMIFIAHAAQWLRIGFVEQMENIAYDQRLLWTMPRTMDNRIVIVDIDERSLTAEGRWPWGRNKVAGLVEDLFEKYQTALVAFDMVFAEPDDSSGLGVLERLAKEEFAQDEKFRAQVQMLQPSLDYDGLLAETIQKYPVILGYYFNFASSSEDASSEDASKIGALPEPVFVKGTFKGKRIGFYTADGYGGNLPQLQSSAFGGGHFNPVLDRDGVLRRVPMLISYDGAYYSSLALEIARKILGEKDVVPVFEKPLFGGGRYLGLEWLRVGAKQIPVDQKISALVPYRGRIGSFPYVSATDIISGQADPSILKGAIVLVGSTAPGLLDLRVTPVGKTYPGVEVHANLLAGIIDGTIKQLPEYTLGAEVLLLVLFGLVMAILVPFLSPFGAVIGTSLLLFGYIGFNFFMWTVGDFVLPVASGVMMLIFMFVSNVLFMAVHAYTAIKGRIESSLKYAGM